MTTNDRTAAARQSKRRASAKASGGSYVSTPINAAATEALQQLKETGHTVRSAIEVALIKLTKPSN